MTSGPARSGPASPAAERAAPAGAGQVRPCAERGRGGGGVRARNRGEEGSVSLWVLYWSFSVLFLAGFGLDLWRGVAVRRSLVEQAEAAAAAGANAVDAEVFRRTGTVVLDPALAETLARENLAAQGDADLVDSALVSVDPATGEVRVELRAEVPFTLIRVFLSDEAPMDVGVAARAAPRIGGP